MGTAAQLSAGTSEYVDAARAVAEFAVIIAKMIKKASFLLIVYLLILQRYFTNNCFIAQIDLEIHLFGEIGGLRYASCTRIDYTK